MFQTLSQIVFPDAFQEHNTSMTNFMNDEIYVHIEEKKILTEQLKEKEEILNSKNNEIEAVAQVYLMQLNAVNSLFLGARRPCQKTCRTSS